MFFLSNNHANASTEDRVKIKLHLNLLAAAVQPSHGTTTGEKKGDGKVLFHGSNLPCDARFLLASLSDGCRHRERDLGGVCGNTVYSCYHVGPSPGTLWRCLIWLCLLGKHISQHQPQGEFLHAALGGRGLLARDARQAFFPGRLAAKCHLPVPSAHPEARDPAAFYFFNGHRDVRAEAREVHKLNAPSSSSSETGSQIEREGAAR